VVVWNGANIGPHADIRDAIITDNAIVNTSLTYMALPVSAIPDPELHRAVQGLGWSIDKTLMNPFPPRGSARTFSRLIASRRRAILVRYSTERPENALYATHARFLARQHVRVPRVLHDQAESNLCVIEDVGNASLESLMPTLSPARMLNLYQLTLDQVLLLHGPAAKAARHQNLELSPAFDRPLFSWEHDLFCKEFLRKHCQLPDSVITSARAELENLIPILQAAPRVLLHRDLQSSNILITRGKPVLIDFQGMRFGPAMYDLASLLCDPYVNLPAKTVRTLLDYYLARIPDGEQRRDEFAVAAAQRLAQALGAFGRLGHNPSTSGFLRHIPAGVRQFLNAAANTGLLPTLHANLSTWAATHLGSENTLSPE
jgi:aminoglycoside/choline kinase family phosphotransferase